MKLQNAFRAVLEREAERLRNLDLSLERLDDGMYIAIPGVIAGVALTTLAFHAGGIMELPSYTVAHAEHLKDEVFAFARDHIQPIAIAGGVISGIGATLFFKGLKEENTELRARWAHAFNKLGHGKDLLDSISQAADKILETNARVHNAATFEQDWLNATLDAKNAKQRAILRTMGYELSQPGRIDELKEAYAYGIKQAFVAAIEARQDIVGTLVQPTRFTEMAVMHGMADYFTATRQDDPTLAQKLKYVFFGDPEILKPSEEATATARAGYKAIKRLRTLDPTYERESPSMG